MALEVLEKRISGNHNFLFRISHSVARPWCRARFLIYHPSLGSLFCFIFLFFFLMSLTRPFLPAKCWITQAVMFIRQKLLIREPLKHGKLPLGQMSNHSNFVYLLKAGETSLEWKWYEYFTLNLWFAWLFWLSCTHSTDKLHCDLLTVHVIAWHSFPFLSFVFTSPEASNGH